MGVKRQWGDKKRFCHFEAYNFGTFRAEAKITIRRHEVVYRLSSERKMIEVLGYKIVFFLFRAPCNESKYALKSNHHES